ncbi:hypothetical protein C8R44DRAFT_296725 [Mycena epipterygia]|nr:hypothetical protein C8R44DRAFT_296725 [Mycena epipterygia]
MMDDELPPSAKRQRTEVDLQSRVNPTPVRSKIWMPYGDIILQAESMQFRVNRDVLAKQSSVFSDMFSVPQPPNEPTVEGCPIVLVSDGAKDWELLLEVLYEPFQYKLALPFEVVASMLRLGKKYDIPMAKENAIWRIHYEFPAQLDAWDKLEPDLTKIEDRAGNTMVDLLNLTYECGVLSSIPAVAFSCLHTKTLEHLFAGVKREDESLIILTDHIKLTLAIAFERILHFQHTTFDWIDDDSVIPQPLCKSPASCTRQRNVFRRGANWTEDDEIRFFTLSDWDEWSDGMCVECKEAGEEFFNAGRHKAWEALPSFFGLPEWKDLKDLD